MAPTPSGNPKTRSLSLCAPRLNSYVPLQYIRAILVFNDPHVIQFDVTEVYEIEQEIAKTSAKAPAVTCWSRKYFGE